MTEHGEMDFQVTALNDLRAQFVQALEADVAPAQRPTRRQWNWEWRRAWAVPVVALAVALVVVAISTLSFGGNPTVAEATADVAKTALSADYPPDGWFTYSRSRQLRRQYSARTPHESFLAGTERRAWLSVGRRGTIETRSLSNPNEPPTVYRYPAHGEYRFGDQTYTRREIDAFAADPQSLIRVIDVQAASIGRGQGELTRWTIITEALRDLSPPLPATLRASLIRQLATIPGTSVVDAERDPLDRPAVGIAYEVEDIRDTVYFDKASSALGYSIVVLARENPKRGGDVKPGDILERFELLESSATRTAPRL